MPFRPPAIDPIGTAAETSIRHLERESLRVAASLTAGELRQRLQRQPAGEWALVCVVDDAGRLLGTLSLPELLALADAEVLGSACHREPVTVAASVDQERMASVALDRGASALPVVAADGRLVGVVGPQALMAVLRREHVEDLHRFAGILRETEQAREAIEDPPLRRARHRLPWLLVGLGGSVLATLVMSRHEQALQQVAALALFVPGLVYLADAIGTQSEAVAVRGLSISHASLGRLLGGELRTGLLLGGVLGTLALALVYAVFGQLALAATVALSLAGASTAACLLGMLLPWLMGRLSFDPAYGSGPLATILQDVLTLLIYFGIAGWLLPASP